MFTVVYQVIFCELAFMQVGIMVLHFTGKTTKVVVNIRAWDQNI